MAEDWASAVEGFTALDFETYLIEAGVLAPRIVCGSTASLDEDGAFHDRAAALARSEALLRDKTRTIVGANIAFDMACLVTARPDLKRLVFDAYAEGRVYDVQVAQALDAIATGEIYVDPRTRAPLRDPVTNKQARYSLAVCTDLMLDRVDAKKNDFWRKRYALLEDVPLEDWPEDAVQYPKDDANNTLEVALAQVLGQNPGAVRGPLKNIEDLSPQVEAAFASHLGAVWGLRTDPVRVAALRLKADAIHESFVARFGKIGFYKPDGKVDKRVVKRALVRAYTPAFDLTGRKCQATCAGGKVLSPKSGKPIDCARCSGTGLDTSEAPRTATGGVSCDRDALMESGDEDLAAFGANEAEKVRDTYLPFLESGLDKPISLRPNILVSSGRMSYDGLIQLLPREGDVRPCFRARGAWCGSPVEYVYCSVDYAAVELCTLAQVCLWVVGRSQMAETINATGDPGSLHTALAASMAGLTVEEMTARLKGLRGPEMKEWAARYRQAAKALNFGLPGGMGAAKLVVAKRKKSEGSTTAPDGAVYPGVRFCILLGGAERCGVQKVTRWRNKDVPPICRACVELVDADLRPAWFKQWPEITPYFEWVSGRVDMGGDFPCFATHRVRGGCTFTNGANNGFQALASDGMKHGLRLLTRECYLGERPDGSPSPLRGTRPIFETHDEIMSEMPRRLAHAAGPRKAQIMVDAMREYTPDVTVRAEPALMNWWEKKAEAKYVTVKCARTRHSDLCCDGRGEYSRLVPWDDDKLEAVA